MTPKSRRTTIYFEPGVHQRLRMRAVEAGRSVSDLVNDLVEAALATEPSGKPYPAVDTSDGSIREPESTYAELSLRIERLERRFGLQEEMTETATRPDSLITLTDVKERLAIHTQELHELGVKSLAVFGSLAKQRFRSGSDIDLLVEFEHSVGLFRLIELEQYLTFILESEIDLVTPGSLRPKLKQKILHEAVHVFPV